MDQDVRLCAVRINHGQSEIWLEANGQELAPRRTLATNEALNVARRHCATEDFAVFHKAYYVALGQIAVLATEFLAGVVGELRLQT